MLKYFIKRILLVLPVILGITVMVFFIIRLIPGDPAMIFLGQDATPEEIIRIRELLGLDRSIFVQLGIYLRNMAMLDFGDSIFIHDSVANIIFEGFGATIELAVASLIISLIIAIPLGIISAIKQNRWIDHVSMAFAQLGVSMPVFWTGILLILLFSVRLGWLPSFGRGVSLYSGFMLMLGGDSEPLIESLRRLAMPAFSLGFMGAALISRMIRSSMLEVLEADYVRTARAKGTSEFKVIMKHAFRNALLPVVTIVGLQFGLLLGGSIVTETVFAWPGLGRIIVNAISMRDFPVVQGGVILIAVSFALINLCTDMLYAVINPKIRT